MDNDERTVDVISPKDNRSELRKKWFNLSNEELNALEAEYIFKAQKKYLLSDLSSPTHWFNVAFLKKIHKEMFFDIWEYGGEFQKTQKTLPGVQPFRTMFSLAFFCADVVSWCNSAPELTFLEQAAIIHHKLIRIQPFKDENGRFARLVTDRYLKSWKCSFPHWPTDLKNNRELKNRYVAVLKSADANDYKPLLEFMRGFGGKDPTLSEILGNNFYKKHFKGERLINLINAYLRLGYNVNEQKALKQI